MAAPQFVLDVVCSGLLLMIRKGNWDQPFASKEISLGCRRAGSRLGQCIFRDLNAALNSMSCVGFSWCG